MNTEDRRLSRRSLLQLALGVGGSLAAGMALPSAQAAAAPAVRPAGSLMTNPVCFETLQSMLDLCATAEGLLVTLYYTTISQADGPFAALPTLAQRELRAALDEEWQHAALLASRLGATPQSDAFYFAGTVFEAGHVGALLEALETFETLAVALYLAALRRAAELHEAVTAEILGQILAIEAEHRAVVREIAQNAPPAPNNRCFEAAELLCVGEAWALLAPYLNGGSGMAGPYVLPQAGAIAQAVGKWGSDHSTPPAQAASCAETVAQIVQISARAAEAIGVTFYFAVVSGPFFHQLPVQQQWYLQAALDEERQHFDFLVANGATALPAQLYFPPGVFDTPAPFLAVLATLEEAFVAAYLAAIQRLAAAGQPLLAEVCGQILGVEAQHRLLGRVMAQQRPANNLSLAPAAYGCLADAAAALQPFLSGGSGYSLAVERPNAAAIAGAVAEFGCAPTKIATAPLFTFAAYVIR